MFDEQPDGDPHGECIEEIHRLQKRVKELEEKLTQSSCKILSQNDLSKKHDLIRSILAHHGIIKPHTAMIADLIYGFEELKN